jgi:hypothetical protein
MPHTFPPPSHVTLLRHSLTRKALRQLKLVIVRITRLWHVAGLGVSPFPSWIYLLITIQVLKLPICASITSATNHVRVSYLLRQHPHYGMSSARHSGIQATSGVVGDAVCGHSEWPATSLTLW